VKKITRMRKNNKSGVEGVFRYIVKAKSGRFEYFYPCWISVDPLSSNKRTRFYDHKCGWSIKAKKLAIKYREEMIKKLGGIL